MKTTKEIVIEYLAEMAIKYMNMMNNSNNEEEFELAHNNLTKIIDIKHIIEKED